LKNKTEVINVENQFRNIEELMKHVESEAWKRAKKMLGKRDATA